jgi:hypothetical protein
MNHANLGSVFITTGGVHAITGRVPRIIGRLPGTIGRVPATVGRMNEKIAAEYHTCLTYYRAEPDTFDMSHGWSENVR